MEVTVRIKYKGEQRTANVEVHGNLPDVDMLCQLIDDLREAASLAWNKEIKTVEPEAPKESPKLVA